jgi:hypothetical protein
MRITFHELAETNFEEKIVGSVNYFSVNLHSEVSRAMNSCLGSGDARP